MMKSVNIDLGKDNDCYPEPMCAKPDGKRYPTIYYDGDEPLGLPKEGTMTIAFKRISESSSETEGKQSYSCTVEVQKITAIDGAVDAPSKKYDEAGDALDTIMKALTKERK